MGGSDLLRVMRCRDDQQQDRHADNWNEFFHYLFPPALEGAEFTDLHFRRYCLSQVGRGKRRKSRCERTACSLAVGFTRDAAPMTSTIPAHVYEALEALRLIVFLLPAGSLLYWPAINLL